MLRPLRLPRLQLLLQLRVLKLLRLQPPLRKLPQLLRKLPQLQRRPLQLLLRMPRLHHQKKKLPRKLLSQLLKKRKNQKLLKLMHKKRKLLPKKFKLKINKT